MFIGLHGFLVSSELKGLCYKLHLFPIHRIGDKGLISEGSARGDPYLSFGHDWSCDYSCPLLLHSLSMANAENSQAVYSAIFLAAP